MKNNVKYGLILLVLIILGYGGYMLQQSGLMQIEQLSALIEGAGVWGPFLFAVLYILISMFGISAAFFTVLAGTLFGTVTGLAIVVISATIAATFAFYIARFFRSKFLNKKGNKDEKKSIIHSLISKIEENAEEKGFVTICILRLSFLPYIPLSYAAGLVKNLKAIDFTLATFITNIFGSFVFIYLGDRLGELLKGNFEAETFITLGVAILLLFLFIKYVPSCVEKFTKKKKVKKVTKN